MTSGKRPCIVSRYLGKGQAGQTGSAAIAVKATGLAALVKCKIAGALRVQSSESDCGFSFPCGLIDLYSLLLKLSSFSFQSSSFLSKENAGFRSFEFSLALYQLSQFCTCQIR